MVSSPERAGANVNLQSNLGIDQWRKLIGSTFAALNITAPDEAQFRAQLRTVELDDVHVFDMTTDAHSVVRSAELVEQDQGKYFKLSLQLDGECELSQDGRRCTLRPGDLGLYVAYRPYRLDYAGPQRCMVMTFPQSVVNLTPAQVELVTARRITQDHGLGRVAVPMFRDLAENMDVLRGPHSMRLVRSALGMLVSVLSSDVLEPGSEQPGDLLVQQASAYIDDHLGDPQLSPGDIAKALYVSVRQLHSRFAAQDLTVSSSIRLKRLEAIRQDLADPALAEETVHSVSTRHGLLDSAHVSKAFKAEYGETPSAYRRRILSGS